MYEVSVNGEEYQIEVTENGVSLNGTDKNIYLNKVENGTVQVITPNGVSYLSIEEGESSKSFALRMGGESFDIDIKDKYDLLLKQLGMDKMLSAQQQDLKAPMPGLVLEVLATEGASVKKGEPLLVLEAMKMENVIKASADVTVKSIMVAPQQVVEKNAVLITFE